LSANQIHPLPFFMGSVPNHSRLRARTDAHTGRLLPPLTPFVCYCKLANRRAFLVVEQGCSWTYETGWVTEGHGTCGITSSVLHEAKKLCESDSHCTAITKQSNVCNGKYRLVYGGPTFQAYVLWQDYDMWGYQLDRSSCPQVSQYEILSYNAAGCASGSEITTFNECKSALVSLGIVHSSPKINRWQFWEGSYTSIPRHCSVREAHIGGDVQGAFNEAASGKGRANQAPVCKKGRCFDHYPSINGIGYGCAGAVWQGGAPSSTYCAGDNGRFPWYSDCCKFQGGVCVPKFD